MAKYEVEMELTGFRLKIRGDREDLPIITTNIHDQITGLIEPAVNIAQGRLPSASETGPVGSQVIGPIKTKRRNSAAQPAAMGNKFQLRLSCNQIRGNGGCRDSHGRRGRKSSGSCSL